MLSAEGVCRQMMARWAVGPSHLDTIYSGRTSCPTGQCGPAHSSRTTSAKTNSRHQRAWGNVSTVFSYFASAAAAFHVHVLACSHLSLPCVYLRSVRSPLHLASWLTLFIALLSAFRADMYFILVFPAWEVLWFVCLFPHDRCYLLYSHCVFIFVGTS